jgi:hypothetical protein
MDPTWRPLEERLGKSRCVGFMYMGRLNGVNQYKHGISRTYLNLDDQGNCYVWDEEFGFVCGSFTSELTELEADLKNWGATLESPYDDEFIARKDRVLRGLGLEIVRVMVEPEDRTLKSESSTLQVN